MKKILSIALIGIMSLAFVSCGTKSPSDVVEAYFSNIKSGNFEESNDLFEDMVSEDFNTNSDTELSDETEKALMNTFKKFDY